MRIAVFADVHGNLPALRAVLADMSSREVSRVINLGDCVSGPLWPRECVEILRGMNAITVRGNHDRWVSGPDPAATGASDAFAAAALDGGQRRWLGELPVMIDAGDGIVAFHATPDDDNTYLIEDIHDGRLIRKPLVAIHDLLGDTRGRIVLCAHSHIPHLIRLRDGTLVVNPGSVGCPAYGDPDRNPHVSESGAPHARYAMLRLHNGQVSVEQIAVVYPWEEAARCAERNARPDWAYALRTGFMPASFERRPG